VSKVIDVARRLRPHMIDPWAFWMIVVAFGVGVFVISWNSVSLRLEVEGTNLAWAAIVAFGVTYHGEWSAAWRTGGGLLVGASAAMAGMYGSMSVLPITALWVAAGIAFTAFAVAVITHLMPRLFSFAGAAVGFGVGIAAARSFPFRPTTPVDDLFTLMLGVALVIAVGTFGSMALRAAIVRIGMRRPREFGLRFIPHRRPVETDDAPTLARPATRVRAAR
jgi:hypothetical protein